MSLKLLSLLLSCLFALANVRISNAAISVATTSAATGPLEGDGSVVNQLSSGSNDLRENYSNLNGVFLKNIQMEDQDLMSDFFFVASYINSTRQMGKCLNIVVKYRYPCQSAYVDYKEMRRTALYYTHPTDELPDNARWENINFAFIKNVTERFNVSGISSQIQVMNSIKPDLQEPGNHGSTITIGNVDSISQPIVNGFEYDCTMYRGMDEFIADVAPSSMAMDGTDDPTTNQLNAWRIVAIIFIGLTSFLTALTMYLGANLMKGNTIEIYSPLIDN